MQVKRVYLVHITQLEPRRLDLETVWVLDSESRSIYKAQVDRSTDSQDTTEMILRIRYVLPSIGPGFISAMCSVGSFCNTLRKQCIDSCHNLATWRGVNGNLYCVNGQVYVVSIGSFELCQWATASCAYGQQ